MRKKIIGVLICMLLITTSLSVVANTFQTIEENGNFFVQKSYSEYIKGEFIVKLKDNNELSDPSLNALNDKYQVESFEKVFNRAEGTILENIYLLNVPEGSDVFSIVCDYSNNPSVVYAEPNCIEGCLPIIPNDEYFPNQWPLKNTGQYGGTPGADIDATEAWEIEKGDPDIVIASIDSGVDYNHEDLADNIWINEDETPNNGVDDDGNGFIDDIVGWDFVDEDNDPLDNPSAPQYGHGTRCAGVHSALTNNSIGVAGVCWNCKTMVVRCYYNYYDLGAFSRGIKYAADNGADVINIEMATDHSSLIEDAVNYAYGEGCYMVAAAGNINTSTPYYPAALDKVTAVGATNQRDEKCEEDDWGEGRGSNWGEWLDVAAPANVMWLLFPGGSYFFMPRVGTSLAAPCVAGLAGLILSINPSLSPDEVKSIICDEDNVDPYKSKFYIGTGRINAYKSLMAAVVITPDLYCEGNLRWENVSAGSTQTGSFEIENIGGNISVLDWNIVKKPSWGEWTIGPMSGNDLGPNSPVTVKVTVVLPEEKNQKKTGEIKIQNKDNPEDYCTIPVYGSWPKNKPYNINQPDQRNVVDHQRLFPILKQVLNMVTVLELLKN